MDVLCYSPSLPMQANCCPDAKQCCAKGYTCSKNSKKCIKTGIVRLMAQNITDKALSLSQGSVDYSDIVAPSVDGRGGVGIWCGGWSHCPSDYTCCRLRQGGYGCCPLPSVGCTQRNYKRECGLLCLNSVGFQVGSNLSAYIKLDSC